MDPGSLEPRTRHGAPVLQPGDAPLDLLMTALPLSRDPRFGVPLSAAVRLRTRTPADATGDRLGMNRGFATGDPAFDARVYVASDLPLRELRALTASPALREAVVALLATTPSRLALLPDGSFSWQLEDAKAPRPPASTLAAGAPALVAAASALPPLREAAASRGPSLRQGVLFVVLFGGILAFFAMVATLVVWEIYGATLTLTSLGGGLLLALLSWPLLVVLFRGTDEGWGMLKACSMMSLLGGPCLTLALARVANCALDDGRPTARRVEVLKTSTNSTKAGISYYAEVRSWRPGEETEHLRISPAMVSERELVVTTKPGLLGAEWLVSVGSPPRAWPR